MPVERKGNKIVEKATGRVIGKSKDAATAQKAVNIRNAITEGGFKPTKRPKGRKKNVGPIASVRG